LTKSAESLEKNRVAFLTSATDLQISAKKSAHVLQENGVNLRDRVRFSKKSLARQDLEGVSTPPEIRLTPINWIRSIWKRLIDLLVGDQNIARGVSHETVSSKVAKRLLPCPPDGCG